MFKWLLPLLLASSAALAQTCPTRPLGTADNSCASTAFVQNAFGAFTPNLTVGTTVINSGTTTRILFDNAGVLGERAVTGTGIIIATSTGSLVNGNCVKIDANGNLVDAGSPCSSGGITQLTGDVTAGPGSGSVAATIANNAVSNAKLATATANTLKGNPTGSTANVTDTVAPVLGNNGGTGGSVTLNGSTSGSVIVQTAAAAGTSTKFQLPATNGANTNVLQTDGTGITSWVAASGGVSPSPITNSLGADVAMNNTANYFTGPSIAQGTTGTWWVSGTVTLQDTSGSATMDCKLWDGTTVVSSTEGISAGISNLSIALSGFLATPAGNLRISCKDKTATTGLIIFNATGNSKDSTVSAFRIQ